MQEGGIGCDGYDTIATDTWRYFFRGCGRSKGRTSWTGMPERGDYQAVIDHLLKADKYPKPSHLIISVSDLE